MTAMTRALTMLVLLRAAAQAAAAAASTASKAAGARHFTVSNPPRKDRFLAAKASQKYRPVAVGDHDCEEVAGPIESEEDCAAAATILWPEGFEAPCTYPVWADNIVTTDEPNEPFGCLVLENPVHGCGLLWNPTGHEHTCDEPGLTCTVVCWEKDSPPANELGSGIDNASIAIGESSTLLEGSNASADEPVELGSGIGNVSENATILEGSNASADGL